MTTTTFKPAPPSDERKKLRDVAEGRLVKFTVGDYYGMRTKAGFVLFPGRYSPNGIVHRDDSYGMDEWLVQELPAGATITLTQE
jgi:hypothetical protein